MKRVWYNFCMTGKKKTSDAQKQAVLRYDRKNTTSFHWKLNRKTDSDVLQRLDEVQNKSAYLKELVRADIQKADKE